MRIDILIMARTIIIITWKGRDWTNSFVSKVKWIYISSMEWNSVRTLQWVCNKERKYKNLTKLKSKQGEIQFEVRLAGIRILHDAWTYFINQEWGQINTWLTTSNWQLEDPWSLLWWTEKQSPLTTPITKEKFDDSIGKLILRKSRRQEFEELEILHRRWYLKLTRGLRAITRTDLLMYETKRNPIHNS